MNMSKLFWVGSRRCRRYATWIFLVLIRRRVNVSTPNFSFKRLEERFESLGAICGPDDEQNRKSEALVTVSSIITAQILALALVHTLQGHQFSIQSHLFEQNGDAEVLGDQP